MDIKSISGLQFSLHRVKLIKLLCIMVIGRQLPTYITIKGDVHVYEDDKIWEPIEEKEELYCFMQLKNKTSKSFRINCVTQRGTWKGQSNEKIVNGQNHVGSYRNFSFEPKKGVCMKNRMVIHEYRLDGDFKTPHNGHVIVHIKRYPKNDTEMNRQEDEKHSDEQVPPHHLHQDEQHPLIQSSQSLQQQHQDEENSLQQFAREIHPLWVGMDWEEQELPAYGDIGNMNLCAWEEEDIKQLLAGMDETNDESLPYYDS